MSAIAPSAGRPAPVAAARHTWLLLAILAGITLASGRARGGAPMGASAGDHVMLYGSLLAAEWLLFYGAWRGLKAYGTPPSSLFGAALRTPQGRWRAAFWGLASLVGIRLLAGAVHVGLARLGAPIAADAARVSAQMAPHGLAESIAWVALSLSAGVCEEFVYRGYFLRQFSAWFGGPVRGVLTSALLFGLCHAYQGPWQVVVITLAYGLPMAVVALVARGLGPTIVAHALEDILSGLTRL